MKNKLSILALIVAVISICSSCKKGGLLDTSEETVLNETTTFTDSINTTAFLTKIYVNTGFQFDIRLFSAGGHSVAADEGVSGRYNGTANGAVTIQYGLIDKNTSSNSFIWMWSLPYENIRRVNVLFKNIDQSPISAGTKKRMIAEARFLRAWYYFLLVRAFGGVPILEDRVYNITDDFTLKRSTYEECVNYILSECDAAMADLPASYVTSSPQDYGRATQGACMGLKSRMLLYAASPLFNGGQFATSGEVRTLTGYQTEDKERWKKAADAALAIISKGDYSLHVDNATRPGYGFYEVFQKRVNNEFLFPSMRPVQREYESFLLPSTRNGGYAFTVSQQIVDRFPMKNGIDINNPASGFDDNNPYKNRDPRFGHSIIYNGAPWILGSNPNVPVDTYVGSGSADAVEGPIRYNTGYFPRKMLKEGVRGNSGNTEGAWPLIRYGEILLNYAEALNEYSGPVPAVYDAIKQLRNRAGIDAGSNGLYGMSATMTKDEMRTFIQNERAIELFMEEHRLWDARRWKTADVDFKKSIEGVKITKTGSKFNYEYVEVRLHTFLPHYGLFPILQSEISKNTALIQNPGW